MSTREEGYDKLLNEGILTDDISLYLGLDCMEGIVDVGESRIQRSEEWGVKSEKYGTTENIRKEYEKRGFLQKRKIS